MKASDASPRTWRNSRDSPVLSANTRGAQAARLRVRGRPHPQILRVGVRRPPHFAPADTNVGLECAGMPRLAVVVPCYNEAARLDAAAFRRFTESRHDLQFVFVNHGSIDTPSEVLHAIAAAAPETFVVVDLPQ